VPVLNLTRRRRGAQFALRLKATSAHYQRLIVSLRKANMTNLPARIGARLTRRVALLQRDGPNPAASILCASVLRRRAPEDGAANEHRVRD
jgi:hypothetical protein